jgi:hypothetical protein
LQGLPQEWDHEFSISQSVENMNMKDTSISPRESRRRTEERQGHCLVLQSRRSTCNVKQSSVGVALPNKDCDEWPEAVVKLSGCGALELSVLRRGDFYCMLCFCCGSARRAWPRQCSLALTLAGSINNRCCGLTQQREERGGENSEASQPL